jgi:hypothetical protein
MTANTKLSNVEIHVLRFYQSIGKSDRSLGRGLRFSVRLRTTAEAVGCSQKTVQRANKHLQALAVLDWGRNRHGLLEYRLVLAGIEHYKIVGVTSAMLKSIRRQLAAYQVWSLDTANREVRRYQRLMRSQMSTL